MTSRPRVLYSTARPLRSPNIETVLSVSWKYLQKAVFNSLKRSIWFMYESYCLLLCVDQTYPSQWTGGYPLCALKYLSGVTCRVEEGRWGIKCWTSWATISYISLQTLPGFPPLSMKRPRHYLAAAVLFFLYGSLTD